MSNLFRLLPAVDKVLADLEGKPKIQTVPRVLLRDLVGEFLDKCRSQIKAGELNENDLNWPVLQQAVYNYVVHGSRPHFRRVINATGVVIHTNLGRSVLAPEAVQAVTEACRSYSNLEFSLQTGQRGSRYSHVEKLLCRLTGAESGLVVNNNAAAVLLILDTLAKGREVIVSRGQLVEIGGSFRIPEVMAHSGAILHEVGATNRTHLRDYEQAIGEQTAALLKVHTSNYRIIGFHKEVGLDELVPLGNKYQLPVIEDLGSGNFFDFSSYPVMFEPTVQQVLGSGVDVISFSGDKLLGGPQAGIILGKNKYIEQIKKNPMNRALRIDKMTLAALEATLRLYFDNQQAKNKIPSLNMITASAPELELRAQSLAAILQKMTTEFKIHIVPGQSRVGGGAFPEQDLPTFLVSLEHQEFGAEDLRDRLLAGELPLIGRIENDKFCLDPRTLADEELELVGKILAQL